MIRSLPIYALACVFSAQPSAAAMEGLRLPELIGLSNNSEPGCAVGIFQDGRRPIIAGIGVADLSSGRSIDGDTQFYAAPVVKADAIIAAIGGLPSINSHPFSALPPFQGRFAATTLPVLYDLRRTETGLEVKIVEKDQRVESERSGFSLRGKSDGSFIDEAEGIRLTPIDGNAAFVLSSGNLSMRFDRVR